VTLLLVGMLVFVEIVQDIWQVEMNGDPGTRNVEKILKRAIFWD